MYLVIREVPADSEHTEKYMLCFHNGEGEPSIGQTYSDDLKKLKSQVNTIEWREPFDGEEVDGNVLYIGE